MAKTNCTMLVHWCAQSMFGEILPKIWSFYVKVASKLYISNTRLMYSNSVCNKFYMNVHN